MSVPTSPSLLHLHMGNFPLEKIQLKALHFGNILFWMSQIAISLLPGQKYNSALHKELQDLHIVSAPQNSSDLNYRIEKSPTQVAKLKKKAIK